MKKHMTWALRFLFILLFLNSGTIFAQTTIQYDYDNLNQQTIKSFSDSSGTFSTYYNYDAAGNLTLKTASKDQNRLINPDFEFDSTNQGIADGWSAYQSGSVANASRSVSSDESNTGRRAQKITVTNMSANAAYGVSQTLNVLSDETYVVNGSLKLNQVLSANQSVVVQVVFQNASQQEIGTKKICELTTVTNGFENLSSLGATGLNACSSREFTTPKNSSKAILRIYINLDSNASAIVNNDTVFFMDSFTMSLKGSSFQDVMPPARPTIQSITNPTESSFMVSMKLGTDNVGTDSYDFYSGNSKLPTTNCSSSGNIVQCTITGLIPGKTYAIRGKNGDAQGNWSSWSKSMNGTTTADITPPTTPTNVNIRTTSQSIRVTYSPSTDNVSVMKYKVYYKKSNDSSFSSFNCGMQLDCTVTGLSSNATYQVYVVAVDQSQLSSSPSTTQTVSTAQSSMPSLAAPSGLTISDVTSKSVKLAWTQATDYTWVQEYRILFMGGLVATVPKDPTTNVQSFVVTNISTTNNVQFSIQACERDSNCSSSVNFNSFNFADDTEAPTIPSNLEVSLDVPVSTTGDYTLSWDASKDNTSVKGYTVKLYQGTSATGTLQKTFTVNATYVYLDNLAANVNYFLEVRAFDMKSTPNVSGAATVTFLVTKDTVKPVLTTFDVITKGKGFAKLAWLPPSGNDQIKEYVIDRVPGTSPNWPKKVTGTSFIDLDSDSGIGNLDGTNGLPAGTYTYSLKAVDQSGNVSDELSEMVNILTTGSSDFESPKVPENITAVSTSSTIKLIWQKDAADIAFYEVFQWNESLKKWEKTNDPLDAGNEQMYEKTDLLPNTTYTFMVRAVDTLPNRSDFSAPISMTTMGKNEVVLYYKPTESNLGTLFANYQLSNELSAPTNWGTNVLTKEFEADPTFANFRKVTIHLNQYKRLFGQWVTNSTPSYKDDNNGSYYSLEAGTYTLQNGILYSGEVDVVLPSAPTYVGVVDQSVAKGVTLRWEPAEDNVGILKYNIYRNGTNIGSSISERFTDSNPTTGTVYTYAVESVDLQGNLSSTRPTYIVTAGNRTLLYYKRGFASPHATYTNPDGTWVSANGSYFQQVDNGIPEDNRYKYPGYSRREFTLAGTSRFSFAFTDTYGNWDNNNNQNYSLPFGTWTYIPAANNISPGRFVLGIPDSQAPSAPYLYANPAKGTTFVKLIWVASKDDTGVKYYDIYRDGSKIATVSSAQTEFTSTGLTPNQLYVFKIHARDQYENTSLASNAIEVKTNANTMTIYYKPLNALATVAYIHYRYPNSFVWQTTAPGTEMSTSEAYSGYKKITLSIDGHGGLPEVAFFYRNANSTITGWDNNGGLNYSLMPAGVWTVENGGKYKGKPSLPDPDAPTDLAVTQANASSVFLKWTLPENTSNISKYRIYRDGLLVQETGTNQTTTFIDTSVVFNMTYTYTILSVGTNGTNGTNSEMSNPVSARTSNVVTIYSKRGTNSPYIHYHNIDGTWTTEPGVAMDQNAPYSGYNQFTVDLGLSKRLEFAFSNGTGTWDNNSNQNYRLEPGVYTFTPSTSGGAGVLTLGVPGDLSKVMIYYVRGFATPYIHYKPSNGSWTTAPGYAMTNNPSFTNVSQHTIDITGSNDAALVFNNGSGTWDNNNGGNYYRNAGVWTFTPAANNTSPGTWKAGAP